MRSDSVHDGAQFRAVAGRGEPELACPLAHELLHHQPLHRVLERGLRERLARGEVPGQEGGTAIGEALFGNVIPSGKLPLSFPAFLAHYLIAHLKEGRYDDAQVLAKRQSPRRSDRQKRLLAQGTVFQELQQPTQADVQERHLPGVGLSGPERLIWIVA